MAFNTYSEGLKIATDAANKAIATESSLASLSPLASPLPTLLKAFPLYIAAAEVYSHLNSSSLVPPGDKTQVARKWRLVLERAEKIKRRVEELGGRIGATELSDDGEEGSVRRNGGRINGITTELWKDPHEHDFTTSSPFRDDAQPELAEEQLSLDPEWAELPRSSWEDVGEDDKRCMVRQGPGADCSVTAGLGACLAHNNQWGTMLGKNALYPQAMSGRPKHSENGKHIVKLLLNGEWRSVVIDALLPRSKITHDPLHITCSPTVHPWLPIAVKGYFKALGGYSIPGSNPAPDVYAFTGWIPERLDFNSGFQREKEWARLSAAWSQGRVIVTLGSGKHPAPSLTSLHAYGVIDVTNEGQQRLLHIFDPGSSKQAITTMSIADRRSSYDLNGQLKDIFTMTWDEVCSKFETLNLNWDPLMMPITTTRHWSWPKPRSENSQDVDDSLSLNASPRFHLITKRPNSGSEIWLLLSQHISSKDRPLDDVALHVFRDHRSRRSCVGYASPKTRNEMNPYANALHSLVRFPVREGVDYLNVVASRDRGLFQTGFTLRVFAPAGTELSMERVSLNLAFNQTVSSIVMAGYDGQTAGGHPGFPSHHTNPQYRLTVGLASSGMVSKKKTILRIVLHGDKDLAWNVKLLRSNGERVFELSSDLIIVASGPFSYGMAYCEINGVDPGDYTLLVSSYERDRIGPYTLRVESTSPIKLSSIPQEGAGMYNRTVRGKWDESSAGGRPSTQTYGCNPHVDLVLSQPATLLSRLQLSNPSPIPINLTIFRREVDGRLGSQVVTSGPYIERMSGVSTGRVKVSPGVYVLIPSTFEAGAKGDWVLDMWADTSFSVEIV